MAHSDAVCTTDVKFFDDALPHAFRHVVDAVAAEAGASPHPHRQQIPQRRETVERLNGIALGNRQVRERRPVCCKCE